MAAGSVIALCLDTDTTWNGNETWIKWNQAAANGNGEFDWTVAGVPAGTYYVAGYLYSNGMPTYSHLTQPINVTAALTLAAAESGLPGQPLPAAELPDGNSLGETFGRTIVVDRGAAANPTPVAAVPPGHDSAGDGWIADLSGAGEREFPEIVRLHALSAANGLTAAERVELLGAVAGELRLVGGDFL